MENHSSRLVQTRRVSINALRNESKKFICEFPDQAIDQFFGISCVNGQFKRKLEDFVTDHPIDLKTFACQYAHTQIAEKVTENPNKPLERLCPPNLQRYRIGFEIPTQFNTFVPFIDLCFNAATSSTIFTMHKLFGTRCRTGRCSTKFKVDDPDTFALVNQNLPTCYKTSNQKIRFPGTVTDDAEKYFAQGHLVPDADGMNSLFSKATYYFLNVIPQWQKNNNGNWKNLVESTARSIADKYNIAHVLTGVRDYQNVNNQNCFCPGGVNIPKWIYKVVLVQPEGKPIPYGIVFVTLNEIRTVAPQPSEHPCSDNCDTTNWLQSTSDVNRLHATKGFTICCSVQDFRSNLGYNLPISATLVGVLENK